MNKMASQIKQRLKSVVGAQTDQREPIHFLHIGKCAGTQIKNAAEIINAQSADLRIIKHGHDTYLDDIPTDERYFFAIRDPISRFRSGFYSRLRRGQPLHDYAWSSGEAAAFARFEHANALAEALFADGETGRHAFMAMKSIRHAAQNQVDWFARFGDIFVSRPPIWVLRQEHFSDDLAVLSARIGVDLRQVVEERGRDSSARHANDYAGVPAFSPEAKANLARWYAQDIAFYGLCEWWIGDQLAGTALDDRTGTGPRGHATT